MPNHETESQGITFGGCVVPDPTRESPPKEINLTIGGGGARVLPAAAGCVLALKKAGIKIKTAGGVSGGFLVAILVMHGIAAARIARMAVEIVFLRMLTMRSFLGLLKAQIFRKINEHLLPIEAVFGSLPLGEFFEKIVGILPKNCWAVSVHGNHGSEYNLRPYVLTSDGVFEQRDDLTYQKVSLGAPSVSMTVRSTCAIPGIIEPIQHTTESRALLLFDGMLTPEGRCPINPILHHYGEERSSILAFDVGEEDPSFMGWLQDRVYEFWCKKCYTELSATNKPENKDIMSVRPRISGIGSIQFGVKPLPKLRAVLNGYLETMRVLVQHGMADEKLLEEARSIDEQMEAIRLRYKADRSIWFWRKKALMAEDVKRLFAKYELYDLS